MSCAHSFGEWCSECIDGMVQQYNTVRAENAQLRETNQRLNRRCQLAEAALNQKVETFEQRSKKSLRAYYYALGREHSKSCPCQHATPCHPECTCVSPASSRGCERCCSYGSPAQQLAKAEALVADLHRARDAWQQRLELDEVRDERAKARTALTKLQDDLKAVLRELREDIRWRRENLDFQIQHNLIDDDAAIRALGELEVQLTTVLKVATVAL